MLLCMKTNLIFCTNEKLYYTILSRQLPVWLSKVITVWMEIRSQDLKFVFIKFFIVCFYCVFVLKPLCELRQSGLQRSRNSRSYVFLCRLLISLLRWPHCNVITEGDWLAGPPEEVIQSEFTDSLTRDIRGASFSHARWSPGSDSTKASGVWGNLTGPGGLQTPVIHECCRHNNTWHWSWIHTWRGTRTALWNITEMFNSILCYLVLFSSWRSFDPM